MRNTDPQGDPKYFTAEELAAQVEAARREAMQQARQEERDKLYPQISKSDDRFKTMEAEVAELRKAEVARQKERDKATAEAEKAKKAKEDAELSAKELLAQREQTWEQKLAEMQAAQDAKMAEIAQQQTLQQAMWEKEREMTNLAIYIRDTAAAHANDIAPELIDLIDGNTKEEVDASAARMVEKTAAIVEGMRQAAISQRAGMPGVAPSGGATALTPGIDTGDKVLTPEAIKGMSMQEFAALRQTMNLPTGQGRGIFG